MTPTEVCAAAAELIRRDGRERLRWTDAYSVFGQVANRQDELVAFKAWLTVEARLWPKLTTGELANGYRTAKEVLAVLDEAARDA